MKKTNDRLAFVLIGVHLWLRKKCLVMKLGLSMVN